jgi:phosphodiesterase/alkaline phosphatase D-like protein
MAGSMRMHRLLPLALTILLLGAAPSAYAARGFQYGVAAGEVTQSSAMLWAKAKKSGRYSLVVARNKRFTKELHGNSARARKSHDNTVQARVRGLKPGKRYFFRFIGRRSASATGSFTTAPKPSQSKTVEFAWSGDQDFNATTGQKKPYWNTGGVLQQMKKERNAFNVMLGDTIYSDSEVPGRLNPIALSVKQKWAKYKVNLKNRPLQALRGSAGFYSQWDDHEFVNDFSPQESSFDNNVNVQGSTLYKRGAQAFRDYAPVHWTKRDGLYRHFRWGRDLEVFFLDERSFRSANADEGHVCDNPQTGSPDLAPTAPQSTRTLFSAVTPSLSQPVSQACIDRINSPSRTFLGRRQIERFKAAVAKSTARFKVIMNEMPIQQYYILPYDRWEGFEAERQELLQYLRQNMKNVVFLTTDVHATMINDARLKTLESGGAVNSGIMDVTVGPVATANFGLEIDQETGQPNSYQLVDGAFLTPPPPGGVGMRCSVLDQFSYGQVKATSTALTITPKDINGQPQMDNGQPCQVTLPYVP